MDTEEKGTSAGTPVQETAATGAAKPAGRPKGGKVFELIPDTRGAQVNGAVFLAYAAVSLTLAIRAHPNSVWFYAFYFLFFLALFQGATTVARHCLHRTPKALVRVEILGKKLRLVRRNGTETELTRNIDYTRRKRVLVLQGSTHDNQKASEVVRAGAMKEGEFDALVNSLKKFR